MTQRILAICAHPDDETLGCGGTLLRHREQGAELHWMIGTESSGGTFGDAFRQRREKQISTVANAFGFASVHRLGFQTTTLDHTPPGEIIAKASSSIADIDPDVVYVVHGGDIHGDHRALHAAIMVTLKPMKKPRPTEIYSYETLSSTNLTPPTVGQPFVPTCYVDISKQVTQKLEIFRLYEGEVYPPPHPRSCEALEALARYRGASVNVHYAEAFMLTRKIWASEDS